MSSNDCGRGRRANVASGAVGVLRVLVLTLAGAVVGGVASLAAGVERGSRTVEQSLGGAVIGGIAGAFVATRYRCSLGMGLGEV